MPQERDLKKAFKLKLVSQSSGSFQMPALGFSSSFLFFPQVSKLPRHFYMFTLILVLCADPEEPLLSLMLPLEYLRQILCGDFPCLAVSHSHFAEPFHPTVNSPRGCLEQVRQFKCFSCSIARFHHFSSFFLS